MEMARRRLPAKKKSISSEPTDSAACNASRRREAAAFGRNDGSRREDGGICLAFHEASQCQSAAAPQRAGGTFDGEMEGEREGLTSASVKMTWCHMSWSHCDVSVNISAEVPHIQSLKIKEIKWIKKENQTLETSHVDSTLAWWCPLIKWPLSVCSHYGTVSGVVSTSLQDCLPLKSMRRAPDELC